MRDERRVLTTKARREKPKSADNNATPGTLAASIDRRFTYHPPHGDQAHRYGEIRLAGMLFARKLLMYAPESPELAIAITRLEETIFWANAAIARNEPAPPAQTTPAS